MVATVDMRAAYTVPKYTPAVRSGASDNTQDVFSTAYTYKTYIAVMIHAHTIAPRALPELQETASPARFRVAHKLRSERQQ